MKISLILIFALATLGSTHAMAQPDSLGMKENLQKHIGYLASDELRGRKAGSEDAAKAAEYICNEWEKIGLEPVGNEYRHPFKRENATYTNLLAKIDGNDEVLKNEIVIIGAHYDHLGVKGGEIYHGADDNVSGVATVIELSRLLIEHKDKLARTIYIAAFDGEELGLYGSNHLSNYLTKERSGKDIALMISADMVGWLAASGNLHIEGTGTIKGGAAMMEEIAKRNQLSIKTKKFENSIMTATDTRGFAMKGNATLAITTGLKSPYHKPQDTAEKIDYDGICNIVNFLDDLICEVAGSPEYKPSGKVASIHRQPKFGVGINVGIGSSHLDFGAKSAVDGRTRTSYRAGLDFSANLSKHFALRLGPGAELARWWTPLQANPLTNRQKSELMQIDIPLDLHYKILSESVFIGAGGYYDYVLYGFNGKDDLTIGEGGLNRHTYGIQLSFGIQTGPLIIEARFRNPLSPLFMDGQNGLGIPEKTRLPSSYFCIGWRF